MSLTWKKKWIALCGVVMTLAIALLCLLPWAKVSAETVSLPTRTTVGTASGFYLDDGASVREQGGGKFGIRFVGHLDEEYFNSVGGNENSEFYAIVYPKGKVTAAQKKSFGSFEFVDGECVFNISIVYDSASFTGDKQAAYATELIAELYMEANGVTYQAYKASEGARSMRAVANAAYLDKGAMNKYYRSEKIAAYLNEGNRTENTVGYVDLGTVNQAEKGKGSVKIPSLTAEMGASYDVCIGAVTYEGTGQENGEITFSGVATTGKVAGATGNISVFDGENEVYSGKVVYADMAVTTASFTKLQSIYADGNTDKYIVLAEDVDFTKVTGWTAYTAPETSALKTVSFNGIFDGLGHTILNYTAPTGNWCGSLFLTLNDAVVKNLAMENVTLTNYNGSIAGRTYGATRFENLYVSVANLAYGAGGIVSVVNNGATFRDVCVEVKATTSPMYCGALTGYFSIGDIVIENSVAMTSVGLPVVSSEHSSNNHKLLSTQGEDYLTGDITALQAYNFLENTPAYVAQEKLIENADKEEIIFLTQENFEQLRDATTQDIVLLEDIDLSNTTWAAYGGNDYKTKVFSGTFDGKGHIISGFTTASTQYCGGLFCKITGTVKNLIVTNATAMGNNGILACRVGTDIAATATFENIVVQFASGNTGRQSAIAAINEGMNLKNVMVVAPNDPTGAAAYLASGAYCYEFNMEGVYLFEGKVGESGSLPVYSRGTEYANKEGLFKSDGVSAALLGEDYFVETNPTATTGINLPTELLRKGFSEIYGLGNEPLYVYSEEQYDIFAYGGVTGNWYQYYDEDGVRQRFYFVLNDDGTITATRDITGKTVVTLQDLERTQTYQNAGFNVLFLDYSLQESSASSSYNFNKGELKKVMDIAHSLGLKCIVYQPNLFNLQYSPWVTYGDNETPMEEETLIGTGEGQFATQADLNAQVAYYLRDLKDHPAFYGLSLRDEPQWHQMKKIGEVYEAIRAVCGEDVYVMANLLPYQLAAWDRQFSPQNWQTQTTLESYRDYLEQYYKYIGQYCGYVRYDSYHLLDNNTVHETYILGMQNAAEFCKEKGIEFAHVFQNLKYNDRRVPSETDMWWQTGIGVAFGVNNYSYYTYYPVVNAGEEVDSTDLSAHIVDRFGNPNPSMYDTVKAINESIRFNSKAMGHFKYQAMRYYYYGDAPTYLFQNLTEKADGLNQGELRAVTSVNGSFATGGSLIVSEFEDASNDTLGYYVMNATAPEQQEAGSATLTFAEEYTHVQIWNGASAETVCLKDGAVTVELGEGRGVFLIPFTRE